MSVETMTTSTGLLPGLRAPIMTPNGVEFSVLLNDHAMREAALSPD